MVWLEPALDTETAGFLIIVTSAVTGAQEALLTVQRKVFTPSERLLAVTTGEVGVAIVPEPVITVQTPVSPLPTKGVEPVKAPVIKQVGVKPATAVTAVGVLKRVIVIVLTLATQGALAIVQVKVVVPTGILLAAVVGKFALPNVTPTALLVHVPIPKAGVFPAKVAVDAQTFWLIPALATVGEGVFVTLTSALVGAQEVLLTVQRKVFTPSERLLAVTTGEAGVAIVPEPVITVQTPVSPLPTTGVEPVKPTVVAQTVAEAATAVTAVGVLKRVIVIVLTLATQGAFAIVHVKVVVPTGKFATELVPKLALPNVTPTALLVHVPTPKAGIFPVKVEVAAHIF